MAQRKNPELDAKHQAILRKMMQAPENKNCADCKGPSPRWASTNLGIFLCISCSGIHRKLGTHISQVRSVTLDTWTPAQIAHFTKFGNARAAQYFEACIPPNFQRPPHGDSMQMERFIRDKYENKRYITVENGGLGGASAEPSYRSSVGSSYGGIGSLGPRPSQVQGTMAYSGGGYDDANTTRRTATSYNSYGGRFGSGSLQSSGGTSGLAHTRRTGGIMGKSTVTPGFRSNAMQRASTMKELINMGFSAQHAARAVGAAEGDLQKAVDWVLEHNDEANVSNIPSFAPPHQAPQKDLLDFDDPVPTPQANVTPNAPEQARPKAMDTELLMSTTSKTIAVSQRTDEADFADFGAFESALPATSEKTSDSSATATNGSLSSTIRNIYKQSPPQKAQPYINGMPHMARIDQPTQAGSPQSKPIRTTVSPKLMAQKAAEANKKIPDTDLGLTSFTGLEKSQHKLSSVTTNAQPWHHQISHFMTSVTPNNGGSPPPPSSPQLGVPVSKTIQHPSSPTPPPPDSPLPSGGMPAEQTAPSTSEPKPTPDPSQSPEQVEKITTDSAEQPQPPEEAKEEDPFAALSIMAMMSAKSKGKKKPAPQLSLQNGAGGVSDFSKQTGDGHKQNNVAAKATTGIDLDELLG